MINRTVSHYRILKELGHGGMGVVYLADDLNLERQVAIKFSTETADRARFLSEARLAGSLNHPNIAAVYDSDETDSGQFFIVMELVKGQKFSDLLKSQELTVDRRLEIVTQITAALAEAHSHKIIHRDIKPGNVIVNEQGLAKVLDFGLAKQLKPVAENDDLYGDTIASPKTQAGTFIGTWLYASPEQARGMSLDADERSDVFSLGVILYQCLTNELPFKGENSLDLAGMISRVEPVAPSSLAPGTDPELERITLRALAKDPDHRYQSAGEMHVDLNNFLVLRASGRSVSAQPVSGQGIADSLQPQSARQLFNREPVTEIARGNKTVSSDSRFGWKSLAILSVILGGWLLLAFGLKWWPFKPVGHIPPLAAERAFTKGIQFLREGDYYQASIVLEQAVEVDGAFVLARARLAEALTEMDYNYEAQQQLNEIQLLVKDRSSLPKSDALYLEAILNSVARKFPAAVRSYEALVKDTSAMEKPNALFDLGRAYEKNDEPQNAIEQFQQVIAIDQQAAAAHLRLAVLYGVRLKDQAKAESEFAQAEKLFRDARSLEGETEVFLQRGMMYDGLNQLPEARRQLSMAQEKSKALTNRYQYVRALLQLSLNSLYQEQVKQAEVEANDALKQARENRMNDLTTRGLIVLGSISHSVKDYEKAEKFFTQALDLADGYGGKYSRALAWSNLCALYTGQDQRLDECLQETEQAGAFFKLSGYLSEELQVLLVQARVNRKKGNVNAAQKAYETVIPLSVRLGDKYNEGIARSEFGRLLMKQSRFEEALDQFNQRCEISKALGQRQGLVYALIYRAEALHRLARLEESSRTIDEARAIMSELSADQAPALKDAFAELKSRLASNLP